MSAAATSAASALELDHMGFVGRDIAAMSKALGRIGFVLTDPQPLMGRDAASGELTSLQQSSCHAVFRHGYLEVSAVVGESPTHHLAAYLERPPGVHILALGAPDVAAVHAKWAAEGFAVTRPGWAARRIDYGKRHGEARFEWFMLEPGETPEALVAVVRNHTPELVFQPQVQRHINGTSALAEAWIVARDLAATAARYERLLGVRPERRRELLRFVLGRGRLCIATAARYEEAVGEAPRHADRVGLIAVEVADPAIVHWQLTHRSVRFRMDGERLIVPPSEASGCAVAFCPED